MQIGRVLGSAANALQRETQRFSQSAHNVANVNTDGFDPAAQAAASKVGAPASRVSTYGRNSLPVSPNEPGEPTPSLTDLAEERVTQLSSLRSFQANVAVLRTADQMLGELVSRKA